MELRSQLARIYLGDAFQVNISAKLGHLLKAKGWKNKEEVYAYYDEKRGQIVVTRDPKEIAEREIWTLPCPRDPRFPYEDDQLEPPMPTQNPM